jgi:hypothetical protein
MVCGPVPKLALFGMRAIPFSSAEAFTACGSVRFENNQIVDVAAVLFGNEWNRPMQAAIFDKVDSLRM